MFNYELKAWRLSQEEFGEFSILTACIYYDVGIEFENSKLLDQAYECFRRTWLIVLQLLGPFHQRTQKAASVIADRYMEMGESLHDSLPKDYDSGPCHNDVDFSSRIAFIQEYFNL